MVTDIRTIDNIINIIKNNVEIWIIYNMGDSERNMRNSKVDIEQKKDINKCLIKQKLIVYRVHRHNK